MQTVTTCRKNIRFRPTGYGVYFAVIVAAMILGSLNYNNNLGLLLAFLLGGMAAASLLHAYKNLTGLQILSAAARPVFAGETAVYELQVCAGSLPHRAISFSFQQAEEMYQDMITGIPRRLLLRIPVDQRGPHDPGPLRIETRYPFGLFRLTAHVSLDIRCLVYPKPVSGPLAAVQSYAGSGSEGGKELPGIDDFKELQPYLPGEPVEHIYWKAFSRGQGLQVKRFVEHAGTVVIFDWNTMKGAKAEHKLSRLCDAVLKAHRFNLFYGLNLPGKSILPDAGNPHRQNCLKALALFQPPV
ncbi:MAG: DUF58 domain-containing protein [Thermodesulfobacteriota bacterium]